MAYIGATPTVGNFQVWDAISVVNGQAAYTLQVGGANVAPESANHMLVSLNGILQKPGSSFTISGSTMTFASNLATGDVIDFVQILGNVLDIGQPSDDTVTAAKLNNDIISGQTALAATPADTDEFLISDAGTIKRIDYSLIKGGITEADMYRITTNFTGNVDPVTSNWERVDDVTFSKIGTGISQSSGIWTFGATGLYKVIFRVSFNISNTDVRYVYNHINTTHDNSTYVEDAVGWGSIADAGGQTYNSAQCSIFINVTDVSNVKFKVGVNAVSTSVNWMGSSNTNYTYIEVIRLGDSQ